jgi:hypothetical protein
MKSSYLYSVISNNEMRTKCLLDFVHRPDKILKYNTKITTFRKLIRLPSLGDHLKTEEEPASETS